MFILTRFREVYGIDLLKNDIEFRYEAEKTRGKFIRLLERYKFDSEKLLQIATDWHNYSVHFHEATQDPVIYEYGVDIEPDYDKLENSRIRMKEIIKRINIIIKEKKNKK